MPLILGIDPGSRQTGYGFLQAPRKGEPVHLHSGVIRTRAAGLPERLGEIFTTLSQLIAHYQPAEVAVEQVFLAHNASSALKLGQARGAAIVAATQHKLPLFEYSAKQIKQAVVGYGGADKQQMQMMMRHHLQLQHMPQSDEADALGVAWCHSQARCSPLHAATEQASGAGALLQASWRGRGRRGQALRHWAESGGGAAKRQQSTLKPTSAEKVSAKSVPAVPAMPFSSSESLQESSSVSQQQPTQILEQPSERHKEYDE
jgi:crossover junction endodeoxyribonuclease RuvC